jgi:tRNA dimethylallyltransferase
VRTPLVIVGPTATGKSSLAQTLARQLDGEIINADALQVYRGFDIGTAKPSRGELEAVRHHLIDILDPAERYSAGRFALLARSALAEIAERDRVAIVVGGSGLYLRALLEGLAPLPAVPPELEIDLAERLAREGLEALRAELAQLDPETAGRLAPGDTQRTVRALGVALSSGKPLSSWIGERPFGQVRIEARRIGLTLDRALLYDRISRRIDRMMASGWLREVRFLLDSGIDPSLPAFQAIGYRQLARHLRGERSLRSAVDSILRATRRYAKRQSTWFRREEGITWFSAADPEMLASEVRSFLER